MYQDAYSTAVTVILPIIIIAILVLYAYLKISYGFWFYAPVFHLYDFHYYIYPRGIVEEGMPEKNKFTNLVDIDMRQFDKIQDGHLFRQFVSFVGAHYMRNRDSSYIPRVADTEPYFTNHKHPCFVSYYYKPQLLHAPRNNSILSRKQVVGVMTTRPVQIQIKKSASSFLKMYGYYVDYLCVHRNHRNNGVAPQLIQTHYYRQRRLNPAIHVNLFKREGDLTGIVPLCVYSTYMFDLRTVASSNTEPELPIIYKRIRCSSQNMRHLTEFMKSVSDVFDITVSPDLSNILDLIKSENYYIDCILDTTKDNEVIGCYVFRKTMVTVEKTKSVIACIASVRSAVFDPSMFFRGFIDSVSTFTPTHERLLVEDLSHNSTLCDKLKDVSTPLATSPTAYFFHNYIYPTFTSSKVLMLGT